MDLFTEHEEDQIILSGSIHEPYDLKNIQNPKELGALHIPCIGTILLIYRPEILAI